MSESKIRSYTKNALQNLLGLDTESSNEIVNYVLSLSSDGEQQSHFLNLLGEGDQSLNFITEFTRLKHEMEKEIHKSHIKTEKKKNEKAQRHEPIPSKASGTAWKNQEEVASSKSGRLSNNKSAVNTSDLLDLTKKGATKVQKVRNSEKKKLTNLAEIEGAIASLEIESSQKTQYSDKVKRVCNCMGARHPLFQIAPNCLNCGKIICAKEGLQPCSYCGEEIISPKDKSDIIKELKYEREELNSSDSNKQAPRNTTQQTKPKSNKLIISMKAGENLWKAQKHALEKIEQEKRNARQMAEQLEQEKKKIEDQQQEFQHYQRIKQVDPELVKAQQRLEKLLEFQETGSERTKIIDNASDFEGPNQKYMMWLSPAEKALMLKKQQKQLKSLEESEESRNGKSKKALQMVIKNGKVSMIEKTISTSCHDAKDEEIEKLEDQIKASKKSNDDELYKGVWDYEKEHKKWDKPTYIASEASVSAAQEENYVPRSRVQTLQNKDETELIVSI